MASSSTFTHLSNGTKFSIDGYPAKFDGTPYIFVKTSDSKATAEDGVVWDFTPSQGLLVHER
jgi:hypothetical protein